MFGDVPSLKEQEDPCRIQLFLFPNKVSTHPIVVIISVFLRKLLPSMFSPHDSEGVKPFPFPSFRVGHVTQAWVNWLWSNSLIRVWLKNSHGLQDSVLRFLLELVGKRSLGLGCSERMLIYGWGQLIFPVNDEIVNIFNSAGHKNLCHNYLTQPPK